jgi:hypothetical protein
MVDFARRMIKSCVPWSRPTGSLVIQVKMAQPSLGCQVKGSPAAKGERAGPRRHLQPEFIQQFIVIASNRKNGRILWQKIAAS